MMVAEISIRNIVILLLCMMIVGNANVEAGTRAGTDIYDSAEQPEPFEPDAPEEAWISLVKGETANVSLQQFYAYADRSKAQRDIVVPDTILVKFGCDSYSFIVGMPFVEMPQNAEIEVLLYRNEKGEDRLYHKFSWSASLNSHSQYTIDEKEVGDTLILFPGRYFIEYVQESESSDFEIEEGTEEGVEESVEDSMEESIDNDSVAIRYRSSVMLPTHSSVNISMKCMEVPLGMIPYVPPSPDILTTDVGSRSLWGEYNVTDLGAATYDLTIEMPKHRYTPKIGISYNSQMLGYGLVGYGINITGISVITRSGKNRYYDKDNKGVTYTDDDAFLLDGQRLVSLGDGKYSIEGSPFTIITRHNDNGRTWFSVIDNGMEYEYGNDASSINRLESGKHCNAIYEWYLCRATDSNGNYAVYEYEKSEMLVYPVKITYGMNDVVAGGECSTVEFEYDRLGDNKRSFVVDGVRGYNNKCLKSITTGTSGSVYRKYLFSYDDSSDNSNCKFTRLQSVVVQTGSGEMSAPIKFQWNELFGNIKADALRTEFQYYESDVTEYYSYYMASDLNADGIFSYAADGTLLSQTDARGVNATYEFDNTGRIFKVTTGDYTVTNTYGTEGYARQRIQRRSDGKNHIDYTYDEYGRVVKESRTVYGQGVFDYEFFYDSNGRVVRSIYPGGLEVTYEHDKYGNIISTKANGITMRSFLDNDGKTMKYLALGRYVYSNKVDDNGYLMELSCAEELDDEQSASERIVNVEYDASTGNLLSRQIGVEDPHTYVYDALDRLTNVSVGGEEVLSIQYADNGNIINKSDVGDYEYMSSRPHAVTEIDNSLNSVPSATQFVCYNDIGKVSAIEQDLLSMTFDYGPDSQRWHSVLIVGPDTIRETVYVGNYERIEDNGVVREFYYLDGNIVIVRQDGVFTPYIAFADEQGSILTMFDEDGSPVFEASYDEWGCQEIALNSIGLQRGYTGQEMMPEFGIINMNGRLYDPVLARFFSPDNFVQEPTNSQNFNRYTYCLNNPLRYTDPSGEWFGIDDLIVAAVGAVVGYVSSGIRTGNWGMKSIKAGICSAAASYLGYNSIGLLSGRSSLTKYLISMGVSSISNAVIPAMSMPLSSSVSCSTSPMLGLGEGGLLCGVSLCFGFNFGDDWNMTVSGGVSNQYAAANISATCKGWGAGYGYTQHFNQPIAQNTTLGRQGVGTISLQLRDVSLRFSNDVVGDRGDKWRSNAVEIGIDDFVFGTYITTGDGSGESTDSNKKSHVIYDKKDYTLDDLEKLNIKKGQTYWKVGNVYSAPFWIGYKSGNQVHRIGYSHKNVQEMTQNFVHKHMAKTPQFKGYNHFNEGVYIYSGYNSPYSLW